MIIHIDWKEISSFTYHIARGNNLIINNPVWLKVIWKWRKYYSILTMTWRIISINSTIFPLRNNQRYVHHITINNSSINVFVIFFICSIIKKNIIIQLLGQPRIWKYLQLYTLPYLVWLTPSFIFESQEIDNIVVQEWKLHGIILIETMPGTNFGSER